MSDSQLPSSLFKYSGRSGLSILQDLKIKVTPPIEFNDPFEFSPYLGKGVTADHIKELIKTTPPEELYEEMVKGGVRLPPLPDFAEKLAQFAPLLQQHGVPMFDGAYRELVAKELNRASQLSGVVCFSEEENHHLLWSHYAHGHTGMVLEFDTSHEYFRKYSRFFKVTYSTTRVPFDPHWKNDGPEVDNFAKKVMLTKSSVWQYENEWRSLYPLHWCEKRVIDKHLHYFTDIPPDLVKRVVLGCRCDEALCSEIINARVANDLTFSLFRATPHETEFQMEYVQC